MVARHHIGSIGALGIRLRTHSGAYDVAANDERRGISMVNMLVIAVVPPNSAQAEQVRAGVFKRQNPSRHFCDVPQVDSGIRSQL